MRKTIIFMALTILGSACSFKNKDQALNQGGAQNQPEIPRYEELKPEDLAKMDSDGDRLNDLEEKERGLNPFVADIPELRVRFLQNYIVKVNDNSGGGMAIDTRVGRNDPDFKYRVGEILVRNKAMQEAAKIGRFSTHSWGDIQEDDLTRVIYPDVDTRFTSLYSLKTGRLLNGKESQDKSITIELENSAKLLTSSVYSSIKNLELNFYYFNHETESYELLSTQTVDRHFNRDVNETFSVTLEKVPSALIDENYLKRGEFIVSEVKDFEIPEIGIKYSELMKSVKAKAVQVVVNTPLEVKGLFVAPDRAKNRFSDLMEKAFPNQFKIEEDKLVKLGQFENNLPDYEHLIEVKGEDKKGKWFVFTNHISQSYLDHEYIPGEAIILSYALGKDLAEQSSEKFNSLRFDVSGGDDYQIYPLGNVSPNSVVDFQFIPERRMGESVEKIDDNPNSPGGSCGKNCISREFSCHFKFNIFHPRDEGYEFQKDLSLELSQISLVIGDDEFSLKDLVESKKVEVFWQGLIPHFRINDILKIKEISEADDNLIAIKVKTIGETTHDGVRLVGYSGRDYPMCFQLAGAAAFHNNWPIAQSSLDLPKWQNVINWSVVRQSGDRSYIQPFSFDISAQVHNFYN